MCTGSYEEKKEQRREKLGRNCKIYIYLYLNTNEAAGSFEVFELLRLRCETKTDLWLFVGEFHISELNLRVMHWLGVQN